MESEAAKDVSRCRVLGRLEAEQRQQGSLSAVVFDEDDRASELFVR